MAEVNDCEHNWKIIDSSVGGHMIVVKLKCYDCFETDVRVLDVTDSNSIMEFN